MVALVTRPLEEFEEALRLVRWGMNDCQISRLTNIPRGTIKEWRHRSIENPGWHPGMARVGANDCPICGKGDRLDQGAYSYLLGMYLGDGYLSAMPRGVYKLRIVLDQRYPLIIEECAQAMHDVRPHSDMKVGRVQRIGCIEVNSHWKHWPCLFPQHGRGRKHERRIWLRPWQEQMTEAHPHKLLRGLIQSDGWRGLNRVRRPVAGQMKSYAYPRYQFTNESGDIRRLFCEACENFGVQWRQMNRKTISVARREDVMKLDCVIGPKA